jgi:hypothetical protein
VVIHSPHQRKDAIHGDFMQHVFEMRDGSVELKLSDADLVHVGQVATARIIDNLPRPSRDNLPRPPRYGAPEGEGSFEVHWIGCVGEKATAIYTGLYWDGSIGDLGAVDVGGRIQVRARSKAYYELMLHPDDADTLPFVLVLIHKLPVVILRGWVFGSEGKQDRFWMEYVKDRPAYFVPHKTMRPMVDLALELEKQAARLEFQAH